MNDEATHLGSQERLFATEQAQNCNRMLALLSYEPTQLYLFLNLSRRSVQFYSIVFARSRPEAEAVVEIIDAFDSLSFAIKCLFHGLVLVFLSRALWLLF